MSGPDSGLGFKSRVIKSFQVVPSSIGGGVALVNSLSAHDTHKRRTSGTYLERQTRNSYTGTSLISTPAHLRTPSGPSDSPTVGSLGGRGLSRQQPQRLGSPRTPYHWCGPGRCPGNLSDTMYLLIGVRKATPPENRQLDILVSRSKEQVDDFVGVLTLGKPKDATPPVPCTLTPLPSEEGTT